MGNKKGIPSMALSKKPYKGCRDFFPLDMRVRNYLFDQMKMTAKLYAYEPYDGPMLEEVDLYLAKSGEEVRKLLGHEPVPFTEVHGSFRFVPVVCQTVQRTLESFQLWELAGFR